MKAWRTTPQTAGCASRLRACSVPNPALRPALAELPGFAELPAVRVGRVVVADGNAYFNRPGPRLVESAEIAAMAIHPERFAGRFGATPAAINKRLVAALSRNGLIAA